MLRVLLDHRKIAPSIVLAGFLVAGVADAAQRTFVASYGNDANSCAIIAPCRSFAVAMANTDADGEIVVLDSAGYGRVTIDQSVSISAPPGVYAGISVFPGMNGVDVNAAFIAVVLRGLTINGQGGVHGIVFTQGSRLYVEQCVVSNMNSRGINLLTGETFITDSTIRNNGIYGVHAASALKLAIDGTRIERNGSTGLRVSNGPFVTVSNSVIAGNSPSSGFGGIEIISDDGASETVFTITRSIVSQNAAQGIRANANGAGSLVRLAVARNTISANAFTGISIGASTGTLIAVITDNAIVRNAADGIAAVGAGVSATIATNAVSWTGSAGVRQTSSALLKTRANNTVQDNTTDVSGTLTFVAGD